MIRFLVLVLAVLSIDTSLWAAPRINKGYTNRTNRTKVSATKKDPFEELAGFMANSFYPKVSWELEAFRIRRKEFPFLADLVTAVDDGKPLRRSDRQKFKFLVR